MQQAPEIKDMVMRLYEAFSRGDADLMEQVTSHQPGLVFIGSDPNEWYEEIAPIRQLLQAQAEAGITVIPGEARAFREGSVGWVADRGKFRLPDGSEVPFRLTAVFHQENGAWKLIQEHASVGVSNEEAVGQELTG
jgi:ketosteroid isomerase-like protein